ncbi:MAG: membrane protein insertase YidC [Candidatus Omnitrophota bacterium]
MEKRLILAIGVSILIVAVYSKISERYFPAPEQPVPVAQPVAAAAPATVNIVPPSSPVAQKAIVAPVSFTPEILASAEIDYNIAPPSGSIVKAVLNKFIDDISKQPVTLLVVDRPGQGMLAIAGSAFFTKALEGGSTLMRQNGFDYTFSSGGRTIRKTLSRVKDKYFSEIEISLDNNTGQNWLEQYEILAFSTRLIPNNMDARFEQIIIHAADKVVRFPPAKIKSSQTLYSGNVDWVAFRTKHFAIMVKPDFPVNAVLGYRNDDQVSVAFTDNLQIAPAEKLVKKLTVYTGPNSLKDLQYNGLGLEKILDSGLIATSLLYVLHGLEKVTHNWGVSIILLSVIIYLVFFPLTSKGMSSMKRMQALSPQIEQLRKTYKDNPQKMNKEVMELYKKNKVNPFGGCLPMLIQIPIFFALYQTLMRSVELRGATFLWIHDLSLPDRLFILPKALPILGNEINILPLLMGAGMFFQQKLSMVSVGQSQQMEQQRMMSTIMPVVFCFIFYRMPSGLVLYWLTNTVLMLIYYYKIRHLHTLQE